MRTTLRVRGPVITVMVLAAALLTGRSSAEPAAEAADTCQTKPGGTSPQGSHWYYRIERSTGRHCWYLGAAGGRGQARTKETAKETAAPARAASPKSASHSKGEAKPTAVIEPRVEATAALASEASGQRGNSMSARAGHSPEEGSSARAAPVAPEPAVRDEEPDNTSAAPTEADASPQFAGRWPALRRALDVKAQDRFSAANNFAEEPARADAGDDMPPVWPVLSPADRAAAAAAKVHWEYLLAVIAGALALAAMLIGAIFNRTPTRSSSPSRWRAFIRRRPEVEAPPRQSLHPVLAAVRRAEAADMSFAPRRYVDPPRPPVPAHDEPVKQTRVPDTDIEATLRRLLQAWQRAAA
jgi:hypothetical protein